MVRGEILPSAWVLQPVIMEGKEITRVIFLAQVTQHCTLSHGIFLSNCIESLGARPSG